MLPTDTIVWYNGEKEVERYQEIDVCEERKIGMRLQINCSRCKMGICTAGFQRLYLTAKDMMIIFHLNDHWQNYYDYCKKWYGSLFHYVSLIILTKSVRMKATNLHHQHQYQYHDHHYSCYFIIIIIPNTIIIIISLIIIRISYECTFSSGLIFTAFIVPLWPLPEATETPEKKQNKTKQMLKHSFKN